MKKDVHALSRVYAFSLIFIRFFFIVIILSKRTDLNPLDKYEKKLKKQVLKIRYR